MSFCFKDFTRFSLFVNDLSIGFSVQISLYTLQLSFYPKIGTAEYAQLPLFKIGTKSLLCTAFRPEPQ
jgi:hypothetical protein